MNLADYAMIANSVPDDVKLISPQDAELKRQNIASLALGNQAQGIKNTQMRQAVGEQDALKQAINKNSQIDPNTHQVSVNHDAVVNDLSNMGHADLASQYQVNQHAQQLKQLADQNEFALNALYAVKNEQDPIKKQQIWDAGRAQMQRFGHDTSNMPAQVDENFINQMIPQVVGAKNLIEEQFKAMSKGGGENVFLPTSKGYIAANKGTAGTKVLTDESGKPYIPANIDIGAQTNLKRSEKQAEADVELATKPNIAAATSASEGLTKQKQDRIQRAIVVAQQIPTLDRAIELQKQIETSGGKNKIRLLQDFLGVQSADEGELNSLYLDNLLGSLKSTFGGNPTEGEREILEQAKASAKTSGGVNSRLLQNARKMADVHVTIGSKDAKSVGDTSSLDAINEYKSVKFGESKQPAAVSPPKKEGGVLHVDAKGNKAYVYPDGSYEEVE
jgi:hypothetical protein